MVDGIDELLSDSPRVFTGIAPTDTPKPAFILVAMPKRTRERTVAKKDGSGFKFETISEEVEGGYMLRAYKGHSIFIENLDELKARGLDKFVPMLKGDEQVSMIPTTAVVQKPSKAA